MSEQERAMQAVERSRASRVGAVARVRDVLMTPAIQAQIAGVTPTVLRAALTPERMVRVALTMVQGSSALAQCTPLSIAGAIIQAAQLGLVPDGLLGHAYLIPRRVGGAWTAQFALGYRGAIALVYRHDRITIRGRVVREGERLVVRDGTTQTIEHERSFSAEQRAIVAAYAVATYPNGSTEARVLDAWEIARAKACSPSVRGQKSSPWDDWPEQMAEKTAIHRLIRQLPVSVDAAQAIATDDALQAGAASMTYSRADSGEVVAEIVDGGDGDGEEDQR